MSNSSQVERSSLFFILQSQYNDKLPHNALLLLQPRLEKLTNAEIESLSFVPLKNPIVGLLLHWFFWFLGAGRFYKGDKWLGLLDIILWISVMCVPVSLLFHSVEDWSKDTLLYFMGAWCAGLVFLVVYFIVELVCIYKGIMQDNFERICSHIEKLG